MNDRKQEQKNDAAPCHGVIPFLDFLREREKVKRRRGKLFISGIEDKESLTKGNSPSLPQRKGASNSGREPTRASSRRAPHHSRRLPRVESQVVPNLQCSISLN